MVLLQLGLLGVGWGFQLVHPHTTPTHTAPHNRRQKVITEGIPKMFRWLTDQYPSIMERISDGLPEGGSDGTQIDNLYLDMNGIIHQCTHGQVGGSEEAMASLSMKEQFIRIFQFTDKICKVVKPRKLIYLAVDGIAPRAKMNQQRSRRFRSAQEREEAQREYAMMKKVSVPKYNHRGGTAANEKESSGLDFDSNCITPGTLFMQKLTVAFKAWLENYVKNDPFYEDVLIIFSGSDLPGEGEHKVMDFVRERRDTWDPNLRHCFYGLDADLIMLSLVTHQRHFRLLREKMTVRQGRKAKDPLSWSRYDFEILEVGCLREMIELQFDGIFDVPDDASKEQRDERNERFVDDFVFACMLIGNDFLPQIPHLDILDGSLDLSFMTYQAIAPMMKGFITDKNQIHLPRFELLARALAAHEFKYFLRRGGVERISEFRDPERYRTYYYEDKFGLDSRDPVEFERQIRTIVAEYVLGLFWCVQYYHRGTAAWDWYYPYLYAPLASDLVNLADLDFAFPSSNSRPFTPLMQLLSVLPPQSKQLLPQAYADAMDHPLLRDAYPDTFEVDPNGKHQPWEAVVLIPFLNEDVMTGVLSQIDHTNELDDQERARNNMQHARPWISRDRVPDDDISSSSMSSSSSSARTKAPVMKPPSSKKPRAPTRRKKASPPAAASATPSAAKKRKPRQRPPPQKADT